MSANLEKKQLLVDEIKEKIEKAKTMVFVNYLGLTVNADTALRREFKASGCEYKVYKNRLMLKALNDLGIEGYSERLQGTLGVAFGYNDEVSVAKIMKKALKENAKMVFAFGIVEKQYADEANIMALANLPSKEVLVAKLLGTLSAPATRLCSVLNGTARALTIALNAIASK